MKLSKRVCILLKYNILSLICEILPDLTEIDDKYAFYVLHKSGCHVAEAHQACSTGIVLADRDPDGNPFPGLIRTVRIWFQSLVHREFRLKNYKILHPQYFLQ